MDTRARKTSTPTKPMARERPVLPAAAVGALAALGINLALWGIGQAAGASFVVDPGLGDSNLEVGGLKVVATTLLPFAVGALLLALAARRSRSWTNRVGVAGVAFAVASAAGPLDGGHDTATGVLLATMHLTTGAAFLLVAMRIRGREHAEDDAHG
jgi:hypothetical protein